MWIIDGIVNGVGVFVRGSAALMRMTQTGSIRTYAASLSSASSWCWRTT